MDNTDSSPSVDDIIATVKKNIRRRKLELERDGKVTIIENKVLSEQLSTIPGIERTLSQMRLAKQKVEQEVTNDVYSHGTISKGEIRRQQPLR